LSQSRTAGRIVFICKNQPAFALRFRILVQAPHLVSFSIPFFAEPFL